MTTPTEETRFKGWPVIHTDYRVDRPIFEHYALLDTDRETAPFLAVEGNAIMGLPPWERAAPRTKSTCPPKPL